MMQFTSFANIVEIVKGYLEAEPNFLGINGTIRLIVDSLIVLAAAVILIIFMAKYLKKKFVLLGILTVLVLGAIIELLDLVIARYVFYAAVLVVICILALTVSAYFKSLVNKKSKARNAKSFVFDEAAKSELIETLLKTIDHLSSRHIGGIITIEKENSLNAYIDKAVRLDAKVSYELLNTIFYPNTALHDGAVIIRGNRILCASAFYPSSEKADIPQYYGSRHRAAIGISEQSDAFTIVVSEETGKIATTIGGTISGNISLDSLKVSLNQHIIVQ